MIASFRALFHHDGYQPRETEHSLTLRILVLLTISVALIATAYATESSPLRPAFALVASGIGTWVSWRRREAKNWWIKVILALLMLVALANFLYEIRDNPFDARIPLANLLIWLQVLHSFDLPRRKDVFYSLWVALILISVAATISRDTLFGFFLLVYALLSLSSLVAAHLSSHKLYQVPRQFWFKISVPALLLSLVGAGVVFVALPRYEGMKIQTFPVSMRIQDLPMFKGEIKNASYPNRSGRSKGESETQAPEKREFDPYAYYGFSTELDLNFRGKLSDHLVMRVRTSRASYWRGMAFDAYDGLRWRMTEPYQLKRIARNRLPLWVRETRELKQNIVQRERVVQTFYIEYDQSNLIFKAPYAEFLYFPTSYVLMDNYGGLRSPIELYEGTTYTVVSEVPQFEAQKLSEVSWEQIANKRVDEVYYQVPETITPRVKALAAQLTQTASSPYESVKLLESHLKREYPYNLEIPEFPEDRDTIDYFLFEQGEGYCEHFASSLAMMARSLGLATRFVTGYTPGQYNPMTGYFEVRGSDAHGWVEVYFPHHGWVNFDPTPGFAANLAPTNVNQRGQMGNIFGYLFEKLPLSWKNGVKLIFASFGRLLGAVFGGFIWLLALLPLRLWLSGALLISALVLGFVFWRSRRSESSGQSFTPRYATEPQRAAFVEAYQAHLKALCRALDLPWEAGKTPREQQFAVAPLLAPEEQRVLLEATDLYYEIRYAQQDLLETQVKETITQMQKLTQRPSEISS